MKKWEVACFILVTTVLSVASASFASQVMTLESQNISLQTQLDQNDLQISSLQTERTSLQNNVTILQGQIGTLQSQNAVLQSEKLAVETQLSGLESQLSSLETQIVDLQLQLQNQQNNKNDILDVYFSPNGGCEDQVLYWISRANSTIEILIYSFTLDSIGDALIQARNRGVQVQVVFETSQISQYSKYQNLKGAGIDVRNDTNSGLMHDKIMVIDGYIVLTGSFNYSDAAENTNNENLLIINSTIIATTYTQEFMKIWNESLPEEQEDGTPPTPPPQQLDINISSINYDAPGNDWDNLNGEYVIIRNNGLENVDLTGWRLLDAVSHTFTFPSFILNAGNTVTIYTGSGSNTQTSLYWGSSAPIWNNDTDTASLYDTDGNLIDRYNY